MRNPITRTTGNEMDAAIASRKRAITHHNDSIVRATQNLYRPDTEARLREQARTELSRRGYASPDEIKRHEDAVVASMAGVIGETNLTGKEVVELRREMLREPLSEGKQVERAGEFVQDMRRPIWGTKAHIETQAAAAKAAAHASPALRKALNTGNAGSSVPLARSLYRRVADGEPVARGGAAPVRPKGILG
jgi:hypothetical protein